MNIEDLTFEQLTEISERTFKGLAFFYRDTTLDDELVAKYRVGQIITERGFTDMSYLGAGLSGNLRYLIASARGKIMPTFGSNGSNGHAVLQPMAVFKILDIYKIGSQTQILLLQIPPDTAAVFAQMSTNVEDNVVELGRKSFDEKIYRSPEPALQDPAWKKRTAPPLGMNEQGQFFLFS